MRSTRFWSPSATRASISRRRFRLFVFLVKMWRACECPRLILPLAVKRKRFAAPLCVFSFGMIAPLIEIDLKRDSVPDYCLPLPATSFALPALRLLLPVSGLLPPAYCHLLSYAAWAQKS